MNTKTFEEIGKLLLLVAAFAVPLIIKFVKNKMKEQQSGKKHVVGVKSTTNSLGKKDSDFNRIMTELFGVNEVKPVQKQPKKRVIRKQQDNTLKSSPKPLNTKKLTPDSPSKNNGFSKIDLKKNVVAKVTRNFSEARHLSQAMTSEDWRKAIIMKEILEPPVALR